MRHCYASAIRLAVWCAMRDSAASAASTPAGAQADNTLAPTDTSRRITVAVAVAQHSRQLAADTAGGCAADSPTPSARGSSAGPASGVVMPVVSATAGRGRVGCVDCAQASVRPATAWCCRRRCQPLCGRLPSSCPE